MGLSDREQKVLEEMERMLYAEDPRFASSMRDAGTPFARSMRTGLLSILLVIGLAGIAAGVATKLTVLGIVGFVAALIGLYGIVRAAIRAMSGDSAATKPAKRTRKSWAERAEERLRDRRDGMQP